MKKLFFSFATVILLIGFQACKPKPADDTSSMGSDSTMVANDTAGMPAPVSAKAVSDTSNRPATPPPDPIKKTP